MKSYTVLSPIKDGDGLHQVGESIQLSDNDGDELKALGAVEEANATAAAPAANPAPTDEAERLAAIKEAIGKLDKANASLWLKGGAPNATAIIAITGWAVTAAERDTAWSALQG